MYHSQYMTEKEVALITGLSLSKLRQDRHACKGIPYHKVGRSIRYSVADIKAFMDECRVEHRAIHGGNSDE
jgi:predicted DNA-binding transcriptional regulator AlpA